MWIVAKIKPKEVNCFRKNMIEKSGENIQFYCPKIEYNRYIRNQIKRVEKPALENYIFCYHENFNNSIFINRIFNNFV